MTLFCSVNIRHSNFFIRYLRKIKKRSDVNVPIACNKGWCFLRNTLFYFKILFRSCSLMFDSVFYILTCFFFPLSFLFLLTKLKEAQNVLYSRYIGSCLFLFHIPIYSAILPVTCVSIKLKYLLLNFLFNQLNGHSKVYVWFLHYLKCCDLLRSYFVPFHVTNIEGIWTHVFCRNWLFTKIGAFTISVIHYTTYNSCCVHDINVSMYKVCVRAAINICCFLYTCNFGIFSPQSDLFL